MMREKRLILDGAQDHIVSHIASQGMAKEMWDTLSTLYQCTSKQRKMYSKENLRCTRMQNRERIDPYLTRIQEIWDQLSIVGATPQATELVQLALNSLSEKWQKELRRDLVKSSISGSNSRLKQVKEEENVALASKGPSQQQGEQQKKKKSLSKVKCFKCGELGHYSTQCPLMKKDKDEKQE
eukprot:PITA_15619